MITHCPSFNSFLQLLLCSSIFFFHSLNCFYQWLSQSCGYGDILRQFSLFTQHPTKIFSIIRFFQYPLKDFLRNTFIKVCTFSNFQKNMSVLKPGAWSQHFKCMVQVPVSVGQVYLIIDQNDTAHCKWLGLSSPLILVLIKLTLGKTD